MAAGWAWRLPVLVRWHEAFLPVVLGNALAFVLLGARLALARGAPPHPRGIDALALAATAVGAVGLLQVALDRDLGLELGSLHAWLDDGSRHPGRMGLNQSLGFVVAGVVCLVNRTHRHAAASRGVLALIFGLLAIGLAGGMGYFLDLHLLDADFTLMRMSVPTALGLVVAALGCGLEWYRATARAGYDSHESERQILLAGGALVALAAMTAGLAGIASQQRTLSHALQASVRSSLDGRIALFDSVRRDAEQRASAISRQPELLRLVALHADGHPSVASAEALHDALQRMLDTGYAGVRIDDTRGRLLAHAGTLAPGDAFAVGVRSRVAAELVWHRSLLLRTTIALNQGAEAVAVLRLEKNLDAFEQDFFDTRGWGVSGEVLLCRGAGDRNVCFPGSAREQPFSIARRGRGDQDAPVTLALGGHSGVMPMRDYRGNHVIAAYTELSPGLGAVLKQNTDELFQPVRDSLMAAIPLLLALVATSVYGLRWHLMPLVSRLARTLRSVAEQEARVRAVVDNVGDGILTMDAQGVVHACNPAACRIFGVDSEALVGHSIAEIVPERLRVEGPRLAARLGRVVGAGIQETVGLRAGTGGGCTEFPLELSVTATCNGDERTLVVMVRDISERQEARRQLVGMAEQMTYQATHDALTGLANRPAFEARVDALLADGAADAEHALLFMDLDQFKVVNDTCGHLAGDDLLRRVAGELKKALRTSDMLARLGGDEFAVVLEGCGVQPALRIAEAMRTRVRDFQFVWGDRAFRVGVSIGAVPFARGRLSRNDLLRGADAACYLAKERGRNRVHLYDDNDADLARRAGEMDWVSRIQTALAEDRFMLYRQRIVAVDARSAEPPRHELLLRLRDERGHIVPPMAFIPAAERYGLMASLDLWVIDRALAVMAGDDRCTRYNINLSGASLGDPQLLPHIAERIERHGIEPGRICFEVTETAAIANLDVATVMMGALRERGCLFALDDFGSGMSSFAYLRQLPVDQLKIDGRFVRRMADDPVDLAMVEAIHTLGHRLGLKTVAEFVEDERILARLRQLGVDYAQGYGIGAPEPLPSTP